MLFGFVTNSHAYRIVWICLVGISFTARAIPGQTRSAGVGPVIGASLGPGYLHRGTFVTSPDDITPPFGVTNSQTVLAGLGLTAWGGARLGDRVEVVVEYLRWWDGTGRQVTGVMAGPALRLGPARTVGLRIAMGSVTVPMESLVHGWGDVESLERTRKAVLALQVGAQYEKRLWKNIAVSVVGRWLVARPSTSLGAQLWYHHQVLQAGIQWAPG